MIHIMLLVLKIIGLILLIILCLVLLLLAVLLFVPVRYRANGEKYGELKIRAKFTWLLHLLTVTAVYENGLDIVIRIFGFSLGKKKSKELMEETGEELSEDEFWDGVSEALSNGEDEGSSQGEDTILLESSDGDSSGEETAEENPSREKKPDEGPKEPDVHIASVENSSEDFAYKSEKPRGFFGRIWDTMKKIPAVIKRKSLAVIQRVKIIFRILWKKWQALEDKVSEVKAFVEDKENQEVFHLIIKQIKVLFRHVLPRKMKGSVRIGFEDPYTTGQAMAVAGLLCPIYKNSIQVCPSFEEPVMEGELACSGRIRLGSLIVIVGKLFLNKRFRFLFRKLIKRE